MGCLSVSRYGGAVLMGLGLNSGNHGFKRKYVINEAGRGLKVKKGRCSTMKEDQINKKGNWMMLSLLGVGIVGAGIGVLLAPKSGREIRSDIRDFTARTRDKVSKTIDEGVLVYEKSKNAVASAIDCGATAFEEKGDRRLKSA
jgi:YtxH-like protein